MSDEHFTFARAITDPSLRRDLMNRALEALKLPGARWTLSRHYLLEAIINDYNDTKWVSWGGILQQSPTGYSVNRAAIDPLMSDTEES